MLEVIAGLPLRLEKLEKLGGGELVLEVKGWKSWTFCEPIFLKKP